MPLPSPSSWLPNLAFLEAKQLVKFWKRNRKKPKDKTMIKEVLRLIVVCYNQGALVISLTSQSYKRLYNRPLFPLPVYPGAYIYKTFLSTFIFLKTKKFPDNTMKRWMKNVCSPLMQQASRYFIQH